MDKFLPYLLCCLVGVGVGYYGAVTKPGDLELNYPVVLRGIEKFAVKSDETRRHTYAIDIPPIAAAQALLKIGVYHAYDDTGDKGMTYALQIRGGDRVKDGFIGRRGWFWVTRKVAAGEQYVFILEDADTSLEGKHAGNVGSVEILLAKMDEP